MSTNEADGSLFILEGSRVRRVRNAFPGFSAADILVASEDGSELYRFDPFGRHLATLDALTNATRYAFAYDAASRLIRIQDMDGLLTTIERATDGTPTAIVGPYGERTTLALDANGYLASAVNPAGDTTRFSYGPSGLMATMRDPNGNLHGFGYDTLGRLARDDDPAGGFTTLSRTEAATSYEVRATTAGDVATGYAVEALGTRGMLRTRTDPDGLAPTLTAEVNDSTAGRSPAGTTDAHVLAADPRFGLQAKFEKSGVVRTPAGLTLSLAGSRTVVLADPADAASLVQQTDSFLVNGRVFRSVYAAATRQAALTSAEGRQVVRRMDAKGRLTMERVSGIDSVTYAYDAQGRLASLSQSGRAWTLGYDAAGRLQTLRDPLLRVDSFFYDPPGRLTRQVLPDSSSILYAYDRNGNLTALTPPGRPAHQFHYTAADLASAYLPPDVNAGPDSTAYSYDLDRQLTRILRPDGTAVDLAYDTAGRLGTRTIPRGSFTFGYNPTTGTLASIAAPGGNTLSYGYDGELLTSATWTGEVSGSVGYVYDSDFRLNATTVNGGNSVTLQYDRDGLLTAAGALTLSRNAANGLLTGSALGSVTTTNSYDGAGRLSGLKASFGASTLFQTTYVRDDLDRITQVTETIGGATTVYNYSYDGVGRLKEVKRDGVVVSSYGYDRNGNRLSYTGPNGSVSGSYDDQDRLLSYASATYTYTAAGELAVKAVGADTTRYTYDPLGNLTAVVLPDGTQIGYVVDGQNRRVGKKVNGVLVQRFLYEDQLRPVAELDASGQVASRFVYGPQVNVPEYLVKGGVTYRLLTDHLGGVRLVVNTSTGAVVERIDYDEFGRVLQDSNPGFQPFGFAGGIYDGQTGLVRFGARDYDSFVGRWMVKDGTGFAGGSPNLYEYAGQTPLEYSDPFGTCPWCIGAAEGAGTDLAVQLAFNGFRFACVDWGEVALSAILSGLTVGIGQAFSTVHTAYAGPARPTYRLLKMKNILRVEAHPPGQRYPNWFSYPHWHPDFAGKPWNKFHWPIVGPLVAVPSTAISSTKDQPCGC